MVATIEAELTRIWDSFEGSNKIRASLFNLIFYTKKTPREKYIRTISQKVIEKFPSRVIFITSDTESTTDYLQSKVSVLTPSAERAACDIIEIDVAGKLEDRVPFVILPHILPDLPIYVIWADEISDSPLFTELKQLATRMIFDSEGTSDLSRFAKNLLSLEEQYKFDIADLNWARTENWRNLLASTFYSQERLEELKLCTNIQIVYNVEQPPFPSQTYIQSLYLQGWIATQLKWKLKKMERENGKISLTYDRQGRTVEINLYPEQHKTLPGGAILSIDLHTEDQSHFSFGRSLDMPTRVNMRFSTLEKCDIPLQYLFAKEESGASLVKEICHKGTSTHFLGLLKGLNEYRKP